jgi:hypothetical protein
MIRKVRSGFPKRSCSIKNLERDGDSAKFHHAPEQLNGSLAANFNQFPTNPFRLISAGPGPRRSPIGSNPLRRTLKRSIETGRSGDSALFPQNPGWIYRLWLRGQVFRPVPGFMLVLHSQPAFGIGGPLSA